MATCLEQGADLHMAQQIPLPLTVSCFSKIQIGFTFLVPAHPGSPGKRAVKRVCVCVFCCKHLHKQYVPIITVPPCVVRWCNRQGVGLATQKVAGSIPGRFALR